MIYYFFFFALGLAIGHTMARYSIAGELFKLEKEWAELKAKYHRLEQDAILARKAYEAAEKNYKEFTENSEETKI